MSEKTCLGEKYIEVVTRGGISNNTKLVHEESNEPKNF